jgi:hypothetical protein
MQTLSAIEYHSAAAVFAGAKEVRARLMNAPACERPKTVVRMLAPPEPREWLVPFDAHVFSRNEFVQFGGLADYQNKTTETSNDPEFQERRIYVEDVVRATARHFGLSLNEIKSKRRTHAITTPRQTGMYISKLLTPRSLPEIGRRWGGFDHTTVLHAVRNIEEARVKIPKIQAAIDAITAALALR